MALVRPRNLDIYVDKPLHRVQTSGIPPERNPKKDLSIFLWMSLEGRNFRPKGRNFRWTEISGQNFQR